METKINENYHKKSILDKSTLKMFSLYKNFLDFFIQVIPGKKIKNSRVYSFVVFETTKTNQNVAQHIWKASDSTYSIRKAHRKHSFYSQRQCSQ